MSDNILQQQDSSYDDAVALDKQGRIDEAVAIFKRLADEGYPLAYFKMASHEFYRGEQEDALPWLAKLEEAAARPDADVCFASFHAYRMNWALIGSPETQVRGSDYIRRAAELGHLKAQLMLALEHRSGANEQVKDEALYLRWINEAIEGGSEDAVYEHVKWLADKGRPISDDLMADLKIVAEDWPNAAKLLERLKRPAKRS